MTFSNRRSASRFSLSDTNKTRLNTILLVGAVVLAVVALIYAIKDKNDMDDLKAKQGPGTAGNRQHFSNNTNNPNNSDYANYNSDPSSLRRQRGNNDWWSNNGGNVGKVYDGSDAANAINGGAAQSTCPPIATAEPAHPNLSSYSGGPSMVNSALANSTAYPDETAAQSLAGKTTYSCAPDITNVGGCDYAINPDNLMPGSWREGVSCSDGTDPNSQWAKYHPTREKYYRYITAAGSARLSANTRSSSRKILGLQNPLRSGTSTPLTNAAISPFNDSPLRAQAIFDAVGQYPDSTGC